MARELKRLNLNLSVDLLEKIDAYAARVGVTRSSAVAILVAQTLEQQQTMTDLAKLVQMYENEKAKNEQGN